MENWLREMHDAFYSWSNTSKLLAVGAAAVGVAVSAHIFFKNRKRPTPFKTDWEKGMVYLCQFERLTPSIPSISPYCLKLETWLRMANIKYTNVKTPMGLRSREGTLPFVELNGTEYPDSGLAIRDLSLLLGKSDLESGFTDEQKGAARAFEKMMEHSSFWSFAQIRYVEQFDKFSTVLPDGALGPLQPFFMWMFKRMMQKALPPRMIAAGIGRHAPNEILNIGLDDLRAISKYLGDKPFMLGKKPSRVDATMFGFLTQMIYTPVESPHKELMTIECPNLKAYCERMREQFWKDDFVIPAEKLLKKN